MFNTALLSRLRKSHGFTIIELLIVIVVIGILATLVFVAYKNISAGAVDRSVQSDLDQLDGLETHYATSISTNSTADAWYSGSGIDTTLNFTASSGNIIDVVVQSGTGDYCICGYNPNSATYKTLATAAIKESTTGICSTLSPSALAVAGSTSPGNFNTLTWSSQVVSWNIISSLSNLASSSDGSRLIAGGSGYINISSDYGNTWTSVGPNIAWTSVASSASGATLTATSNSGYIYTSTDYGSTWTQRITAPNGFSHVVMTSDGTKQVALDNYDDSGAGSGGYYYSSTNSGTSWVMQSTQKWWGYDSLAMTPDGSSLVSADRIGSIYISSNLGSTWTTLSGAGNHPWFGPTFLKSDGSAIAYLTPSATYVTYDYGATWTTMTLPSGVTANGIVSSADGSKIFITGYDNFIYASINGGLTWTQQTSLGSKIWTRIVCSSDGSRVYVFTTTGGNKLYSGVYGP